MNNLNVWVGLGEFEHQLTGRKTYGVIFKVGESPENSVEIGKRIFRTKGEAVMEYLRIRAENEANANQN